MKDSQLSAVVGFGLSKYIKVNNERFSTFPSAEMLTP